MQTAMNPVNPALAQVIGAMDTIKPVTPEGTPTVAAQVLQAAKMAQQPALPQVAQQAGLAGQIQAMQMQDAQKELMSAAMQQQRQEPAGLEGLNPQMGNFAEGGIVGSVPGYATGELAEDEYDRRLREAERSGKFRQTILGGSKSRAPEGMGADERERLLEVIAATTPMMPIPEVEVPAAPPPSATGAQRPPSMTAAPAAPGGGGIESLFEKERAGYRAMKGPATPEQIMEQERRTRAVKDEYLRSIGIDPDAFTKRAEEDKALMEQQRALLRERMEREQGRDTFLSRAGAALRGFSQMRGQGAGPGIARSSEALARYLESGEARMDQLRDIELKINELDVNRRRALDDARRATAEGNWKGAEQSMNNAAAFSNEIEKMVAGTYGKQAAQVVEQQKAREAGASRMADQQRIQDLYQLRLNSLAQGKPPTDEQKMQAMEYALQTVRGAGGAARAQTAAEALNLKRQELASKVPAYNLAQMTAYSTSPSINEEKRQQARQVMAQIEAQYGISGGPAPTGGAEGFKLLSVQPSPR